MRQRDASDLVDQFIDIVLSHQFALLLLDPDAQLFRLRQGMLRISRSARRLLPLASRISEVGNTALVERDAITLPLDHKFAVIGSGAIVVFGKLGRAGGRWLSGSRSRDRLGDGGRPMVTVSVISVIPVASP